MRRTTHRARGGRSSLGSQSYSSPSVSFRSVACIGSTQARSNVLVENSTRHVSGRFEVSDLLRPATDPLEVGDQLFAR